MTRRYPLPLLAVALVAAVSACAKSGEFRHEAHLTVTKGDCAVCHGTDRAAPRRATDGDCAACHRQAQEASPSGRGRYGVARRPPPARSGSDGAARFTHAPHAAAGIPCTDCHAVSKWRGNMFVRPTAEECEGCHSGPPQRDARRSPGRPVPEF